MDLRLSLGRFQHRVVQRPGRKIFFRWELSDEIRTMSYLLHPPLMDEAGLSGALGWYVEGLQQRGGRLKIEISLPPGIGRFSDETEMAVFRVV